MAEEGWLQSDVSLLEHGMGWMGLGIQMCADSPLPRLVPEMTGPSIESATEIGSVVSSAMGFRSEAATSQTVRAARAAMEQTQGRAM